MISTTTVISQERSEAERREGEDVEGEVLLEDGVRLIESDGVEETEDGLPLRGRFSGKEKGRERGGADADPHEHPLGVRKVACRHDLACRRLHFCVKPKGRVEVGRRKHCKDQKPEQEQPDLGGHHSQEDLFVAQVAEPEPVRIKRPAPGHAAPDDDQDHSEQDPLEIRVSLAKSRSSSLIWGIWS